MIAVGEIWHLQGSFQGALGLDNCVRYICNRPCLYLTEEHLIRWEFCLVNQKLFHLIWSASENQSVRTHRRQNPIFEEQRKLQSTQVKRTPWGVNCSRSSDICLICSRSSRKRLKDINQINKNAISRL